MTRAGVASRSAPPRNGAGNDAADEGWTPPPRRRNRLPVTSGLVAFVVPGVVVVSIVGLAITMSKTNYDIWGGFWVAPLLLALTVPFATHAARAEGDSRLTRTIMLAALLRIAVGAATRYWQVFVLYGGSADAGQYDVAGSGFAPAFRHLDFSAVGELSGTKAISAATGVVYAVIGESTLGGFMVYSWLAFIGLWCMYRAFVIAYPGGDRVRYRRLLFFFPSMWFWPSEIGKEAALIFLIGLATLGFAWLVTGRLQGLVLAGLAMWASLIVRPHMTLIMLIGFAAGLVSVSYQRRARAGATSRNNSRLLPTLLATLVLIASVSFVEGRVAQFLHVDTLDTTAANQVLSHVSGRTTEGGSTFKATAVTGPVQFGEATITVLFRPFPGEVKGAAGIIAGVEGFCLLVIALLSIPRLRRVPRAMRDSPLVPAALVSTIAFIYAFAALGNFGILARERSQILPFVFVLLSVPAKSAVDAARPRGRRRAAHRSSRSARTT